MSAQSAAQRSGSFSVMQSSRISAGTQRKIISACSLMARRNADSSAPTLIELIACERARKPDNQPSFHVAPYIHITTTHQHLVGRGGARWNLCQIPRQRNVCVVVELSHSSAAVTTAGKPIQTQTTLPPPRCMEFRSWFRSQSPVCLFVRQIVRRAFL